MKCVHCNSEISFIANVCPHCHRETKTSQEIAVAIFMAAIGSFGVSVLIGAITSFGFGVATFFICLVVTTIPLARKRAKIKSPPAEVAVVPAQQDKANELKAAVELLKSAGFKITN